MWALQWKKELTDDQKSLPAGHVINTLTKQDFLHSSLLAFCISLNFAMQFFEQLMYTEMCE